jgi:uncharacterized protein YutE (UPF0331/DUF86 family)
MTDPMIVLRKLVTLREHLGRARARRPATAAELADDTLLQDALAMSLLVAVQEAIDVSFHIAADEGWAMPGSAEEAFEALATHGVLTRDLARALATIARLRNRLAHGYAAVDIERLWTELPAGIATLAAFVEAIAKFVDDTQSGAE